MEGDWIDWRLRAIADWLEDAGPGPGDAWGGAFATAAELSSRLKMMTRLVQYHANPAAPCEPGSGSDSLTNTVSEYVSILSSPGLGAEVDAALYKGVLLLSPILNLVRTIVDVGLEPGSQPAFFDGPLASIRIKHPTLRDLKQLKYSDAEVDAMLCL